MCSEPSAQEIRDSGTIALLQVRLRDAEFALRMERLLLVAVQKQSRRWAYVAGIAVGVAVGLLAAVIYLSMR